MTNTQIKIFTEGNNKFAEKVNPFDQIESWPTSAYAPVLNREYVNFSKDNPTIAYLGTRPDGVYDAELFEGVWQYQERGDTKWQNAHWREDEPCPYEYFVNYQNYMYNFHDCGTRQALTDKGTVNEDVCIVCDENILNKTFCADCGLNVSEDRKDDLADKANVKYVESVDVVQSVLDYLHKNITASVVYEDFYDFSKGINGATVDYFPETSNELFLEMGLSIRTPIQAETMISDLKTLVEERNVKIKKLIDASMAVILASKPEQDGFTILPNRLVKGLADAIKGE